MNFILPNTYAVTLTNTAINHFNNIAAGKIVKFSLEGGGCAGFQYKWNILNDKTELQNDDEIIEYDNFTFVVDGAGILFLLGATVDYLTDITGSHIEVTNPQAKAGCGCGVSVAF